MRSHVIHHASTPRDADAASLSRLNPSSTRRGFKSCEGVRFKLLWDQVQVVVASAVVGVLLTLSRDTLTIFRLHISKVLELNCRVTLNPKF